MSISDRRTAEGLPSATELGRCGENRNGALACEWSAGGARAMWDVSADWHVVGTGDFNGDGLTDILWRNDDGSITDWLADPTS
jgi:hypothetical protein